MSFLIPAFKAALQQRIQASAVLAPLTYRWGLHQSYDGTSLPLIEAAVLRVPAEVDAQGLVNRLPEIEVHIVRSGGDDLEDLCELDAREAERAVIDALNSFTEFDAFELRGWEFQPADGSGKRAIRTAVTVAAMIKEDFNAG